MVALVYSGLVSLDATGEPQPDLTDDWEFSEDGRSVTFHLKEGVKWHSGAPFTAEDVVFTYSLLKDKELPADPSQAALWQSITCVATDSFTVECSLPEPYAPFLTYASVGILPRHILDGVPAANIADDPFNRSPIGTGPYRLSRLDDRRAILESNDEFYGGDPGVDEIELRFFPDSAAAVASVVRGESQGVLTDLTTSPEDYATLRSLAGIEAHTSNRSAETILYLNNSQAPLNDPAVRQAIAHAVDPDAIITEVLEGRAVRASTPMPPGTWASSSDTESRDHDLGTAREILDDAGWTLDESTGLRQKGGTELRITVITDQDSLRGAVAEAIAGQLADAGISVTVVQSEQDELIRDYLNTRDYQAAIFGWDVGADVDPYPAWHSSQALDPGKNIASYVSDAADDLMEGGRRTIETGDRADLYAQFEQLFVLDAASVPLYSPLYTYFVSERIDGIGAGVLFTNGSRFHSVVSWTIERTPGMGS
jgi:peptide/nickel transport system substrate-binding protein